MQRVTLRRILLRMALLLPIPSVSLAQQAAVEVLQTALAYRGLQSFWCVDDSGQVLLSAIATQGQLTNRLHIRAFARHIPAQREARPEQPFQLRLRKLSLRRNQTKAKLRFVYHDRVKARLTLHLHEGVWRVTSAFIRQRTPCDPEVEGSRFVWDF